MAFDETIYDLPWIEVTDVQARSFTVNMTIHTGGIFYTPEKYTIEIWNSTDGSSVKSLDITDLALSDFPYTVTSFKGGEKIFLLVVAHFADGKETNSFPEVVNTPYEPITSIKVYDETSGEEITKITTRDGWINYTFHKAYSDTVILPSNASVLDGTRKRVNYVIDNDTIATVDDSGVIRGIKRGTTKLYIKPADNINTETAQFVCEVEVLQSVTGIAFERESLTISVGSTAELSATISPSNANIQDVTYTITDSNIAEISENIVTGKAVGSTMITATAADTAKGTFTATMLLNVSTDTAVWNEINTCPQYLNSSDFNVISQNAKYVYNLSGITETLTFPTVSMTTDSLTVTAAIKNLIHSVAVMSSSISGVVTPIDEDSIDYTYAPSQSLWNKIIKSINEMCALLENQ